MKNIWNKLAISLGDSFYSIILGRSESLHFMIYFEKSLFLFWLEFCIDVVIQILLWEWLLASESRIYTFYDKKIVICRPLCHDINMWKLLIRLVVTKFYVRIDIFKILGTHASRKLKTFTNESLSKKIMARTRLWNKYLKDRSGENKT